MNTFLLKPFAIAILFAVLLQGCEKSAATYTHEITQAELQAKVDLMMPLEKRKPPVTVVITNPVIDLLEATNEIGIAADIEVKGPLGLSGNGRLSLKGTIRYDVTTQVFFFDNLSIIDLDIPKIPQRMMPFIKPALEVAARDHLAKKPVMKFKDEKLKHKLAKATLKSVRVEKDKLVAELSLF